jgi:hypothetical protein
VGASEKSNAGLGAEVHQLLHLHLLVHHLQVLRRFHLTSTVFPLLAFSCTVADFPFPLIQGIRSEAVDYRVTRPRRRGSELKQQFPSLRLFSVKTFCTFFLNELGALI